MNSKPKSLTACRDLFLKPGSPRQRMYEALRAYYVEERPSAQVARDFGYSPGSFRVLCHDFRRNPDPQFFVAPKPGPQAQPKKSAVRETVLRMRKQNFSIYEISSHLKEQHAKGTGASLSPTAVGEILKEEGFAPLPRRLDEERPVAIGPTIESTADARAFSLEPRTFSTQCGGLFLFVPDWVRLNLDDVAAKSQLPGSKMIPAAHALRSCLALKLWGIERHNRVMSLVADQGLALFAGLNVIPKKSFLSEYSSRITHRETLKILAEWQHHLVPGEVLKSDSFNLDFHSAPFFGKDEIVQDHFVAMRSRRQPSILVFLAQDEDGRAFCYSNADIRKGEERGEILNFVAFWKKVHGKLPGELVFDSQLTTYANLGKLDGMGIPFITLRRRTPSIRKEIEALAPSAWRRIELDVPTREYRHPRIFEQQVTLVGRTYRQIFVADLGHEDATVLLTNQPSVRAEKLITRYARRMLIENALSDAVRFFHMNALSSAVGLKVDFDMSLLVVASGLYKLLAGRIRGYSDAQARTVFDDIVNMPADVTITDKEVRVELHRRAHLPLILASELADKPVAVPWWDNRKLRITTHRGAES
ncbi:MAG: hypothetical protein JWM85_1515 [Acidimicrobiaceae bacterium]|nr:hypothetical protein [Acidimicrobiaceae bacterium]